MKGPIFRSTQNCNKRMHERSLRRRIEFYLKQAGLKRKNLASHSIRRCSATFAFQAGATPFELMQHLDHADLAVSTKYIGQLNQSKHKASERIKIKI